MFHVDHTNRRTAAHPAAVSWKQPPLTRSRQCRSEWTRAIRGGRRLGCSELAGRLWPLWKSPPRARPTTAYTLIAQRGGQELSRSVLNLTGESRPRARLRSTAGLRKSCWLPSRHKARRWSWPARLSNLRHGKRRLLRRPDTVIHPVDLGCVSCRPIGSYFTVARRELSREWRVPHARRAGCARDCLVRVGACRDNTRETGIDTGSSRFVPSTAPRSSCWSRPGHAPCEH